MGTEFCSSDDSPYEPSVRFYATGAPKNLTKVQVVRGTSTEIYLSHFHVIIQQPKEKKKVIADLPTLWSKGNKLSKQLMGMSLHYMKA